MWRVVDHVSFVDHAVVEAYHTTKPDVREHLVEEAKNQACSVRLLAHLVAGYFGEDDVFTQILRRLHVELSDLIAAIVRVRASIDAARGPSGATGC